MVSVTLPEGYEYVVLAAASYMWLTQWQGVVVGNKRKAAKVDYPQTYAEKAHQDSNKNALIFNCAQRAHANTLEHINDVMFSTLLAGLRYPTLTAGLGFAWTAGRVLYTLGYTTGNPKSRNTWGFLAPLSGYVLNFAATWSAIELARGNW